MVPASRTHCFPEARRKHHARGQEAYAIRTNDMARTAHRFEGMTTGMTLVEKLQALIEPTVEAAGFELVRVAFFPQPSPTLQIMVEDPATGQMLVDDCATVSEHISALLDETDPIEGEYALEVSSPGIDRPLTRLKDFERWAGHLAKVELQTAREINGTDRRRFQGPLAGIDGEDILIVVDDLGKISLPFAEIRVAKLLLTDALIAASKALGAQSADDPGAQSADDDDNEDDPESPVTMQ